ncbi:hypothetical protein DFH06DRAFT_1190666 [Mycena polygramma]|nr:hypothetical protein DFH06DRAFT_1190666 [Mycena polygramma]
MSPRVGAIHPEPSRASSSASVDAAASPCPISDKKTRTPTVVDAATQDAPSRGSLIGDQHIEPLGEHCDVMWCANLLCRYFSSTRYPPIQSRFSSSCYTLVLWNSMTTSSSRLMPTRKISLPANSDSSLDGCKPASPPRLSLSTVKVQARKQSSPELSPLNPPRTPTPSRMLLSWITNDFQGQNQASQIQVQAAGPRSLAFSLKPFRSSTSYASWNLVLPTAIGTRTLSDSNASVHTYRAIHLLFPHYFICAVFL